jgi:hypothetical protein
MRIIDSGDQATVAAYDAANSRLVLVTVRGDSPQRITYDLSKFTTVGGASGGKVRAWLTDAKPNGTIGRQYLRVADLALSGKQLSADFSAYSVMSFEIDNVKI